ncbi:MAG: Na+/H+ antiporter NhaC family protein [Flaviflexus sp.]|uniref:Na+/H+ antiporter NhaC family protein n=1 Tax=Flaviflexus sp. TaxID=1969482 RepID=UPI00352F9955
MVETAYSLIAPIVVIILLLTTKRLVPSLIIGIILGSLLYADWNPLNAAEAAGGWMWDVLTGEWKILTFTLLVGALSSMLRVSGGVSAFADWAYVHANTPRKAQLAVLFVGFLTFFSDGFSCLLRANVLRSLTDKHRVSHSKLAYLVHSSSAPYALMVPISAIAGMTIAIISRTYDSIGMNTNQAFSAFIQAIPMNYYNILTIILVFIVAITGLNLGTMGKHERLARDKGILFDASKSHRMRIAAESENAVDIDHGAPRGTIADLMVPIFTLLGVTVDMSFVIANQNAEGPITVSSFLQSTDIVLSLVYGTIVAMIVSAIMSAAKKVSLGAAAKSAGTGVLSILQSAIILYLAIVTAEVMKGTGVGAYLAGVIETNNFPVALLPLVLFVFSAFMSYAMGSTLGTAGLMIPIGAEIFVNIDPWFLIPVVGAVLPGCVFGEHTSPLSDTTIMSSIGSQVDAFDHIITQMPYAIITSIASIIGYLVLGYCQDVAIGLITALGTLILLVFAAKFYYQRRPDDGSDYEVLETTSPEEATR